MHAFDQIIGFDHFVAQALNARAILPLPLNRLVVLLSEANFLKVAPFVAVVAWYWNRPPIDRHRRIILTGMVGIFLAFCAGRILQVVLPFRARPIHDAMLELTLPQGVSAEMLGGWSSFPSDHAAIFAAMVGLLFCLSWRWGLAGLVYAIALVLAPRVYIGAHFLTDVTVGFLAGLAVMAFCLRPSIARLLALPLQRFAVAQPAWFYAVSILLLGQLMVMFSDARMYASIAKGLMQGTLL